jgi:hypothetical protein
MADAEKPSGSGAKKTVRNTVVGLAIAGATFFGGRALMNSTENALSGTPPEPFEMTIGDKGQVTGIKGTPPGKTYIANSHIDDSLGVIGSRIVEGSVIDEEVFSPHPPVPEQETKPEPEIVRDTVVIEKIIKEQPTIINNTIEVTKEVPSKPDTVYVEVAKKIEPESDLESEPNKEVKIIYRSDMTYYYLAYGYTFYTYRAYRGYCLLWHLPVYHKHHIHYRQDHARYRPAPPPPNYVKPTGRPVVEGGGRPDVGGSGRPDVDGGGRPDAERGGRPDVEHGNETGLSRNEIYGSGRSGATNASSSGRSSGSSNSTSVSKKTTPTVGQSSSGRSSSSSGSSYSLGSRGSLYQGNGSSSSSSSSGRSSGSSSSRTSSSSSGRTSR